MDRWMPTLNGFEATRQMRQMPELARVPIIAISASVLEQDQDQSRQAGIDAFLPKPVNWADLAALLQEHLGLEWESLAPAASSEASAEPSSRTFVPSSGRGAQAEGLSRALSRDRSAGDAEDRDREGIAVVLTPPPQEEMDVLIDLALRGNLWAIQERAVSIETLGEQYIPFARKLRELAKGFEEKQIVTLIERYMEQDQ
jgi:DNA-binding NarL/FixJ family response regulator